MRLVAASLFLMLASIPLAQASYSFTECFDKYHTRYAKDEDLKKFCYARMACSGIEQDMDRLACLARNNKDEALAECVKKFNCSDSTCLVAATFSCAGTCDKGQGRPQGTRKCVGRSAAHITIDLKNCPEGFQPNMATGRCDKSADIAVPALPALDPVTPSPAPAGY